VDKASSMHQATSKFHKFLPSDQEWQSQHIHNRKNSAPQLREKSAFLKHLIRILGKIEVCISIDIYTIHPSSPAIRVRILFIFIIVNGVISKLSSMNDRSHTPISHMLSCLHKNRFSLCSNTSRGGLSSSSSERFRFRFAIRIEIRLLADTHNTIASAFA
jgi:hypothetical protein